MERESFQDFCRTLPACDDKFVRIDVDIVEIREKAVLVEAMTGIHSKRQWLPKSQLAFCDLGRSYGIGLAAKRSWIARNRLWWMV